MPPQPPIRVDSHMHVWQAAVTEIIGAKTLVPPQTDVPIDAARTVMVEQNIARAVLVQPMFRGEDNEYLVQCVRAAPDRFAAVCVIDPRTSGPEARLAYWFHRGCRGLRLRPRIAEEERIFGDPSTYPLWEIAERLGVVLSLLCSPAHLARIDALAERFSGVSIAIDHMGHPDSAAGVDDPRFRQLLALARRENVFVKLSGFYHFSREGFPFAECWPLVRAVYEHFGPHRLMWGSDFPHVTVTCGYAQSLQVLDRALSGRPAADRDAVMGGNALKLYWPAG